MTKAAIVTAAAVTAILGTEALTVRPPGRARRARSPIRGPGRAWPGSAPAPRGQLWTRPWGRSGRHLDEEESGRGDDDDREDEDEIEFFFFCVPPRPLPFFYLSCASWRLLVVAAKPASEFWPRRTPGLFPGPTFDRGTRTPSHRG